MNLRYAAAFLLASTVCGFQPPIAPARHYILNRGRAFASTKESASVERLENSAVLVHIPVPGTATKAAYDKVCTELSKQIQIPGFRKGSKIPPQVLEQSMAAKGGRNALKVQAIKELVGQLVEPTMKEQALDPIGQPTLKVSAEDLAETFVPGEDLMLDVQCDVWPEIRWKGEGKPYVGLKASYQRKPFNQEKLDKATMDLRERYNTLEPITDSDYTLQMGDACTVNMVGYMADKDGKKGEPLPNAASGDNVEVILGKGRYMEGLVEGLVGAKPGETVTVSVSFPEKLRDKTLAGKRAIFDVEVLDASKRIIPELTDEFAAKVRAGLTKESLLDELRKAVDQEDAKEFVPARNRALGKALAQVLEVDVPDTLVTNQAREKFAVMMAEMRDGGVADAEIKKQINPENFLKYKDIVKDDIISDFKVSMATDEIARMEGITVPSYQVEEQMESIRKDAAESKEEFDEAMIRGKVETTLQRQAVYDWLAENAEMDVEFVEEEQFDEKLMQKLAEESLKREEKGMPVVEAEVTETKNADVKEEPAKPKPVVAAKEEVEEPPAKEEVATEPVAAAKEESPKAVVKEEPPAPAEPEIDESKMTVQERAFNALLRAGAISVNKSPDDPDYDHSKDSEIADGTVFKN